MAQIKDFVVRSGVIVQGTTDVTTTTGAVGSLEVRSGASIAKTLIVGGSTTIYGNEILYGNMSITGRTTASGIVNITNSTAATTGGAGALTVAGGAYLGDNLVVSSLTANTGTISNNALYVAGGVGIGNSLVVSGQVLFKDVVTFSGTATYVYSTNTVVTDNIINLHTPPGGVGGAWAINDGKDIGFVFHNYISADNDAFLGWANDTGYLEWYSTGTESVGGVFTPGQYGVFKTGAIILTSSTQATSTVSGALQVAGGIGVGGDIYVGGGVNANSLNSRSLTSGKVVIVGASGLLTEDDGLSYNATTNLLTTTVTNAITATNLSGTLSASIPYQTNPGITGYVPIGNSDEVLTVTAGVPTWRSIATLPATSSSVVATNLAGGILGQIPYQVTTSTTSFIGTGTNGSILQMGASSTATFVTTGSIYIGNAVTATNIRGGTSGAIPYQNAAGVTQFINTGTSGSILQMGSNTATFVSTSSIYVGDAVVATNIRGGILGVIPYQNASGTTLFIGTGTNGSILQMGANNTATFVTTSSILVGSAVTATNVSNVAGGTSGAIVYQVSSGVTDFISTGTSGSLLQMGANTATFVTTSSVYVGNAVTTTNILGGTAGALVYQNASGITQFIGTGTTGTILVMGTNTATFVSSSSVYVGFSNQAVYANTATNLAGGTLGVIPYQNASGVTLFIGTNTSGSLLQMGASNTATFITTGSIYVGNAVTATNIRGGTAGALTYQSAPGVTQFIGTGTVGSLLRMGTNTATFVTTSSVHVASADFAATANTVLGSVSTASTVIISDDQSSAVPYYMLAVQATSGAQTLKGNSSFGPYFTPSTGQLVVNTTTDASSSITGALVVRGGAGFGKRVFIGDGTASNATNTGALQVVGGVGIGGSIVAGGSVQAGTSANGTTINGFNSNNFLISSFTSNTISTTSTQNLDTYTTSSYRTAKYTVQIVDGTSVHASELLVFHANGNVYLNEYGIVTSGNILGTFDASIVSGSVTLQFTPSVATSMTIKLVRTVISS